MAQGIIYAQAEARATARPTFVRMFRLAVCEGVLTGFSIISDAVLLTLAAVVGFWGRAELTFLKPFNADPMLQSTAAGFVVLWISVLALVGSYDASVRGMGVVEASRLLRASMITMGLVGVAAFLFNYNFSRAFFFIFFALGIPILLSTRLVMRWFVHTARRYGHMMSPVLVAGDPAHVNDLAKVLRREHWLGYKVVGALVPESLMGREILAGIPVIGTPERTREALEASQATAVIFAEGSFERAEHFNRLARDLEHQHAQMIVVPALTDVSAQRMNVRPVAGLPLVHIESPRAELAGRWEKRAFDIIASSILIFLLSPVLAAVALAVKRDDGGPVMFRQERVGLNGELFKCLKFRSMCLDAEARLATLQAHNESDGVLFKMARDPRITRVGAFIRRFSLDELPQLFNVWRGDMSLVGPRPALPKEVAQYQTDMLRRLDVRPGITGLWQVSGRSSLSWEETVRLDLYYVDNWSFVQDVSILGKTVRAVFGGDGAF